MPIDPLEAPFTLKRGNIHRVPGNFVLLNSPGVIVKKAIGEATQVTLPKKPRRWQMAFIKDGKGDAATNNITAVGADGELIDGAATLVIEDDYAGALLGFDEEQWVTLATSIPSAPPAVFSFSPAIAAQGQYVVITGANFTNASDVSFGGTAAQSVSVDSPTQITAVVPAGATGSVTVANSRGTGTLAGFTFANLGKIGSFWKSNEATSAIRVDAIGSNNLANNGGASQATPINNSEFATAFANQSLSIPSNSTLQTGTGKFHLGFLVRPTSNATAQDLVAKDSGTAAGYVVRTDDATGAGLNGSRIELLIRQASGADCTRFRHSTAIAGLTSYFVEAGWDGANGFIGINNGTLQTSAGTGTPANETANFAIGFSGGTHFNGKIQCAFWAKDNLTTGERGVLYNGGVILEPQGGGNWDASLSVTAFDNPSLGISWGQTLKLPDGSLASIYTDSSNFDDGIIYIKRAFNPGATWSSAVPIIPATGGGAEFGCAIVTANGRILVGWYNSPPNAGRISYSDDNGASWTHGIIGVPSGYTRVTPDGQMVQEASGTLVMACSALHTSDSRFHSILLQSVDNGITWTLRSVVASSVVVNVDYTDFAYADLGGLNRLAVVRYNATGPTVNKTYRKNSTDGGVTWGAETEFDTGVYLVQHHLTWLADGVTLIYGGNDRTNGQHPAVYRSTNGGVSFGLQMNVSSNLTDPTLWAGYVRVVEMTPGGCLAFLGSHGGSGHVQDGYQNVDFIRFYPGLMP